MLDDQHDLSAHIPPSRAAGGLHRAVRAPLQRAAWRESIADVVTIPEDADGHIDLDGARRAAGEVRRPAAEDRLVLGRVQRDRHRLRHRGISELLHRHGALSFWDFAAAAPYVDIEMNAPAGRPLAYKDAIFLSPHKFIGGPGDPGRAGRAARAVRQPRARRARRRHRRLRQPDEHRYLDDPPQREEGGTPAIIESIRAGLVFQLKQAVGDETIRAAEERLLAARGRRRGATSPAIEILGNLDAERLSIVSFVVRSPAGRYLHHNFVVVAAQRPVRHPGPRRLLVRRPVRSPPARHRPRALARVRARDHRRLRGHQARLGAGQLQLLHLRHRRRLHRRGGAAGRPRRLAAARRTTASTRHRPVAAPRRPGRAADQPARDLLRRGSGADAQRAAHRG